MIVDCAVYEHGKRHPGCEHVRDAIDVAHAMPPAFVWIGLREPTKEEFDTVTEAFDLHPLAVEDAIRAHQRPKLERYGRDLFVVLKTARYVDRTEVVEIGEIMVFVGSNYVITVRHGSAIDLKPVRASLEADPDRLARGPVAVLHAVADAVVDKYGEVLLDLDVDIDEIQAEVFSGPRASHAERIFRLKREVLDFRHAVEPLAPPLEELSRTMLPGGDTWAQEYFRDILDHTVRAAERLRVVDGLLTDALNANVAQVGIRQNEDMRKISAWVAIAAVPTMMAGIYGMNFQHMPELNWKYGYPVALAVMVGLCLLLYRNFKRRRWL